jgi:hypothetical protein
MTVPKGLPKFKNGAKEDRLYAASDRALDAALRAFEPFLGMHSAAELRDFFLWQVGCHLYPELRFIEGCNSEEVTNVVAEHLRAVHARRMQRSKKAE